MKTLLVTGLPGAEHVEFAAAVAEHLDVPMVDTDVLVETMLGVPIAQAFVDCGEVRVRAAEAVAFTEATARGGVIAVGSGVAECPAHLEVLESQPSIFCDVGVGVAAKRLGMTLSVTALVNPRATWIKLAGSRRPLYADLAELTVDTNDVPAVKQLPQLVEDGVFTRLW